MAEYIICRADARAKGLKWYFTGKPCMHGHLSQRLVSSGECKTCSYAKTKRWAVKNSDYRSRYLKEWHENNPSRRRELQIAWETKNKERQIEWRKQNAIELRRRAAEWAKKNPEKCRLHSRNRRALKKTTGTHTLEEIEALLKKQKYRCASCLASIKSIGRNIRHADHIIPLSVGGTNDISNIQMLCQPCNSRKYNKDPFDWARENGRLL